MKPLDYGVYKSGEAPWVGDTTYSPSGKKIEVIAIQAIQAPYFIPRVWWREDIREHYSEEHLFEWWHLIGWNNIPETITCSAITSYCTLICRLEEEDEDE